MQTGLDPARHQVGADAAFGAPSLGEQVGQGVEQALRRVGLEPDIGLDVDDVADRGGDGELVVDRPDIGRVEGGRYIGDELRVG